VRAIGAISGFLFVAVGAPGLVSALLKRLIGRARPEGLDTFGTLWFEPGAWAQYSLQGLPSGHATTSFALAFALVALFGRWWGVAFALAALIALSRIVVGAHFLTDVLAGALLGTLGAMLVRAVFIRRGWIFDADGKNRMLAPLRLWWRRLSRPRRRGSA
jgi:undecaprenyl-diphosphatase